MIGSGSFGVDYPPVQMQTRETTRSHRGDRLGRFNTVSCNFRTFYFLFFCCIETMLTKVDSLMTTFNDSLNCQFLCTIFQAWLRRC